MEKYMIPSTTLEAILNRTNEVLQTEQNMSADEKSQLQHIVSLCNKAQNKDDDAFDELLELVSNDPWCWMCIPNFNEYDESGAPELCVQHPNGALVFQPLKY